MVVLLDCPTIIPDAMKTTTLKTPTPQAPTGTPSTTGPRAPLSLKPRQAGSVSTGTVRQSFSHGRTKTVVVERDLPFAADRIWRTGPMHLACKRSGNWLTAAWVWSKFLALANFLKQVSPLTTRTRM